MADAFGLDDYSLLSGPQQDTARTIQRAFDASLASRNRSLERFNLQTMGPMLTAFANDSALRRAQTTAGILNNNDQLQKVMDYANRSPHGLAENLSAYLPAVGALSRLYPMLFGTNTALSSNGILPTAYNAVSNWFKPSATNALGGFGMQDRGIGYFGDVGNLGNSGIWNSGYDLPSGDWGSFDWTSGFDLPMDTGWTSGFDLDWGF
jgi:hypothetical protein